MIDFFWEFRQQQQVSQAETEARAAQREVGNHQSRIRDLEQQLGRVAPVSQALWELLRDKTGLSEEELIDKITEVDLRDGAQGNRLSPQVIPCPKCDRNLTTKHQRCIYCGTNLPKPHIYQ